MAPRRIGYVRRDPIGPFDNANLLEPTNIVRLWALRILVCLGAWRNLAEGRRSGAAYVLSGDEAVVIESLGLAKLSTDEIEDGVPLSSLRKDLVKQVIKSHVEAEKQQNLAEAPPLLRGSIERLSQLVGLNPTESAVLEFAVLLRVDRVLRAASDNLGALSNAQTIKVLSGVLGLSDKLVAQAVARGGKLATAGLLTVDQDFERLRGKLQLLSSEFSERMLLGDFDSGRMFKEIVLPAPLPQISLSDFDHVADSLRVLLPYLKSSLHAGRNGVNILLYGPPGTGKTQLSRVIAAEIAGELFQVSCQDEDGDPSGSGEQRLMAYRAAQCFLGQNHALLLFDECEDVFSDAGSGFARKSTAQTRKGWINGILEGNRVPTIWVANSIDDIDPAFLRRFDLVLELPVPPRRQREKIIGKLCGELLDKDAIRRMSCSEHLAPAVVAKAASVAASIRDSLPAGDVPQVMEMLVNKSLAAQGLPRLAKKSDEAQSWQFDPSLVHTDADLAELAHGLCETRSGRVCLYGPPGTGKTAFGRWLADQVQMPLHVRRASDLLSKWVGETEKNIAGCFASAEQEGALLMIDEVDSFLQERAKATQSWEVTAVNEFLTQMEGYQGIFVASTNLVDSLDQAALRRFDLKLKFGHLTQDQAWTLFMRKCGELGVESASSGLRHKLQQLKCLTPGDFAAVMRRHRFSRIASATDMLAALEAECAVKGDQGRKTVGF